MTFDSVNFTLRRPCLLLINVSGKIHFLLQFLILRSRIHVRADDSLPSKLSTRSRILHDSLISTFLFHFCFRDDPGHNRICIVALVVAHTGNCCHMEYADNVVHPNEDSRKSDTNRTLVQFRLRCVLKVKTGKCFCMTGLSQLSPFHVDLGVLNRLLSRPVNSHPVVMRQGKYLLV